MKYKLKVDCKNQYGIKFKYRYKDISLSECYMRVNILSLNLIIIEVQIINLDIK